MRTLFLLLLFTLFTAVAVDAQVTQPFYGVIDVTSSSGTSPNWQVTGNFSTSRAGVSAGNILVNDYLYVRYVLGSTDHVVKCRVSLVMNVTDPEVTLSLVEEGTVSMSFFPAGVSPIARRTAIRDIFVEVPGIQEEIETAINADLISIVDTIPSGGGSGTLDTLYSDGTITIYGPDLDSLKIAQQGALNAQVLKWNSTSMKWEPGNDATGGSGTGETNNGINLGDGEGIYISNADTTLQFRSIKSGNALLSVTQTDTTLVLLVQDSLSFYVNDVGFLTTRIDVDEDDVLADSDVSGLDFGEGIDVTPDGTESDISLNFSEFTTEASIAAGDFIIFRDIAPASNKKITLANFESLLTITESQISDLSHTVDTDTHIDVDEDNVLADSDVSGIDFGEGFDVTPEGTESDVTLNFSDFVADAVIAAGDLIVFRDISPAANNTITFANFESLLTITESQISDLAHTTDTDTHIDVDEDNVLADSDVSGLDFGEGFDVTPEGTESDITLNFSDFVADATIAAGDLLVFRDISPAANNTITFANLEALLTITESQISDLSHTTDTDTHIDVDEDNVLADSDVSGLDFGEGFDVTPDGTESDITLNFSDLTTDATIAAGDLIVFRDISPASNDNITFANLEAALTLTESQISDLSHTIDTDKQTVDTFDFSANILTLALENDSEAPYTVNLSSLAGGADAADTIVFMGYGSSFFFNATDSAYVGKESLYEINEDVFAYDQRRDSIGVLIESTDHPDAAGRPLNAPPQAIGATDGNVIDRVDNNLTFFNKIVFEYKRRNPEHIIFVLTTGKGSTPFSVLGNAGADRDSLGSYIDEAILENDIYNHFDYVILGHGQGEQDTLEQDWLNFKTWLEQDKGVADQRTTYFFSDAAQENEEYNRYTRQIASRYDEFKTGFAFADSLENDFDGTHASVDEIYAAGESYYRSLFEGHDVSPFANTSWKIDYDQDPATIDDNWVLTYDSILMVAHWAIAPGSGGGITSFSIGGDVGSDETVTDGELVDYLGGLGIESTVGTSPTSITMAFVPTEFATVTAASGDQIVIEDIDDTGTPKTATISAIDVGLFNDDGTYSLAAHTHLLAAGATDVTATAAELNLLDLAGLTAGHVLAADGATTASWQQLSISDLNDDGDFIENADISGTGIVAKTGASTYATRTITGDANEIVIANGDGVSGAPSIGIVDDATFPGVAGVVIPAGTTAQRGAGTSGKIRLNTTDSKFEGYNGTAWIQFLLDTRAVNTTSPLAGGGVLTTDRDISIDIEGLTEDGSPASNDWILVEDNAGGGFNKVQVGNVGSGGGGEANTASNQGAGGVGLFDTKTGVDLEFKNINAGSNKISVTNDAGNTEVDIDVNEANLTITESQISDLAHTTDTDTHIDVDEDNVLADSDVSGLDFGEGFDVTPEGTEADITLNFSDFTTDATIAAGDLILFRDIAPASNDNITFANFEAALTITESQISDLDHDDPDAIHDNVASEISAITLKATPVSGDILLIEDSEDSDNKKRITIGTLPGGATDHGALTGLSDDDHLQYALLAGRLGGQTLIGGTGSSNNLILQSTSDATKGAVTVSGATVLNVDTEVDIASQTAGDDVLSIHGIASQTGDYIVVDSAGVNVMVLEQDGTLTLTKDGDIATPVEKIQLGVDPSAFTFGTVVNGVAFPRTSDGAFVNFIGTVNTDDIGIRGRDNVELYSNEDRTVTADNTVGIRFDLYGVGTYDSTTAGVALAVFESTGTIKESNIQDLETATPVSGNSFMFYNGTELKHMDWDDFATLLDVSIYNSDGTIGSNRVATITDEITFHEPSANTTNSSIFTISADITHSAGSGRTRLLDLDPQIDQSDPATESYSVLYIDTQDTDANGTDNRLLDFSGKGTQVYVMDVEGQVTHTPHLLQATGDEYGLRVTPFVNKSTSGDYTALEIDVTENAVTGADDRLIDALVGGADRWAVASDGEMFLRDGIRQTFNPDGTNSGLNIGSHTAEPSSPTDGDIFYDATATQIKGRVNGAWVDLGGSVSVGGSDTQVQYNNGGVLGGMSVLTYNDATNLMVYSPVLDENTGNEVGFQISPTVDKLTSGAYTALEIDVTETDVNTGNLMLDLQVGSSTVFSVDPTGLLSLPDGITQTFNPDGTEVGLNVGSHTADPSSPENGDLFYNSTSEALRARINGAWVSLGAGGGGFTDFDIDGDNNSPQTITDGNEFLITGGTGALTTAQATDELVVDVLTYTIDGSADADSILETATYVEVWRDTIDYFTSDTKEAYEAKLLLRWVNTNGTDFLDFQLSIDDESTDAVIGTATDDIRLSAGDDEVIPVTIWVAPGNEGEEIIATFEAANENGTSAMGGVLTVDDKTGNIIVTLDLRGATTGVDYYEVEDWWATKVIRE